MVEEHGEGGCQETDVAREVVGILDLFVRRPALEAAAKDPEAFGHFASVFLLLSEVHTCVQEHDSEVDPEFTCEMEKDTSGQIGREIKTAIDKLACFVEGGAVPEEDRKMIAQLLDRVHPRFYLAPYLIRGMIWASISVLACEYVAGRVVLRAMFELAVCIATRRKRGTMKERICGVVYLSGEEKEVAKGLWDSLCDWAHPISATWQRVVCPTFYFRPPMYHPSLSRESMATLLQVADIVLVVACESFRIGARLSAWIRETGADISAYPMLSRRLSTGDD